MKECAFAEIKRQPSLRVRLKFCGRRSACWENSSFLSRGVRQRYQNLLVSKFNNGPPESLLAKSGTELNPALPFNLFPWPSEGERAPGVKLLPPRVENLLQKEPSDSDYDAFLL